MTAIAVKASELLPMVRASNLLEFFHDGCHSRIAYNGYGQQFYCTGCAIKWSLAWVQEQAQLETTAVPYGPQIKPTAIYRLLIYV